MSKTERIVSKLENHYSILEFISKNYPEILAGWKNENAGLPAQQTTQVPEPAATTLGDQNGNYANT